MIGALTHGGIYLIKHFTQGIIYSTFKVIALILLVTASMHMKVIEYPYSEVYRKLKTISIYTVGVGAILLLSINLEVNLYNTSMIRSTLKPIQVTLGISSVLTLALSMAMVVLEHTCPLV